MKRKKKYEKLDSIRTQKVKQGLWSRLSGNACSVCTKPLLHSQHWGVKGRGPGLQSHPWLYGEFKASLDYLRFHLQKQSPECPHSYACCHTVQCLL